VARSYLPGSRPPGNNASHELCGAAQARAPHAFGGLDPVPDRVETVVIDLDRHVLAFQALPQRRGRWLGEA
jgi:hypothetical protein